MTTPLVPVAITLTGCAKTFADGTRALLPLDLEIRPGERLAVLGPSGCGKTTLLRLIAGLERPDAGGRIRFDDQDVTPLPIERRGVGMVFQSYALFPNMTVAGNVGYGLRLRRVARAERDARVRRMLELVRIPHLAERRIDQISGGQRQRVALARALAVEPRILLLDEPLTALDAGLRDDLRAELHDLLSRLSVTALYVTHDQAEAMALGDRVVVMDHGRIAQIGTPREIYHRPAETFVAGFVGQLNRLPGQVTADGLTTAAGTVPCRYLAHGRGGVFAFRPERGRLAAVSGDSGGGLAGTVDGAFFLGDRLRLRVRLADGTAIQLDQPGHQAVAVGAAVTVVVDADAWFPLCPEAAEAAQ